VITRRVMASWLAALLLLLTFIAPSFAFDEAKLRDAERLATLLQAQLRGVSARVGTGNLTDDGLAAQRTTLEKIKSAAGVGASNAGGPLSEITSQVNGLGPPPQDGSQETESIATQRKELNAQLARATAAQKQFVLVGLEADQALARLTALQRSQFLQRVFKADRSIVSPTLWRDTWNGASVFVSRLETLVSQAVADAEPRANRTGFLLLPVGLFIFGLVLFRAVPRLARRFGLLTEDIDEKPSGLARLWHVIFNYIKYLLLLVVFVVLVLAALDVSGYQTRDVGNFMRILTDALQPAFLYGGLMYFVTSPYNPRWRLVAVEGGAAKALVLIVALAYLVYGIGDQITSYASTINLPVSFAVGQTALSAFLLIILIACGLVLVRREAMKGLASEGNPYFLTWFMNFMPLWWVLLGVASLALLFGFIALSYFIAGNLLDTAILAIGMGLLYSFTDALAAAAVDARSRTGHTLRRFSQWSDAGIQRVVLILRTISDATLVVLGLLTLVALWSNVLFDLQSFFASLSDGIRIGNISLSPPAILIAILVLTAGATATRYVTRWLERRVLPETQFDKGVQDSLRAVAGYTGYSLAAIFALTAAGLDFSSMALVFGALGVGIGLGLQSVVNNFVSGLILLAERPVRVGDWVVTNAGEGLVKKINVRTTELETFDNCSIIIPNSNLVAEPVRNWTHRDSVGRFTVSVTFTHAADAADLTKRLAAIVQAHPKIMRHPPPIVQLSRISTTGLEFDIRAHVRDIFESPQVASDLRIEIASTIPHELMSSTLPPAPPPPKTKAKS
jgi:potassium-dependent mechanosensitive channel